MPLINAHFTPYGRRGRVYIFQPRHPPINRLSTLHFTPRNNFQSLRRSSTRSSRKMPSLTICRTLLRRSPSINGLFSSCRSHEKADLIEYLVRKSPLNIVFSSTHRILEARNIILFYKKSLTLPPRCAILNTELKRGVWTFFIVRFPLFIEARKNTFLR